MQHALKHVERPGGSHEGVGRNKNICPCTNGLFCLCSCKDRAFSATSATLEEKKSALAVCCLRPRHHNGDHIGKFRHHIGRSKHHNGYHSKLRRHFIRLQPLWRRRWASCPLWSHPGCNRCWLDPCAAGDVLWKFDTLWEHPLGKGEATCHSSWLYSLCTEDTWKATARVHRVMEDW